MGKKLLEFTVELRCQRFVMGQHQRGTVDFLNDIGHCKGFARAGNAQKHLGVQAVLNALHQLFNCLGLIAGRLERGY